METAYHNSISYCFLIGKYLFLLKHFKRKKINIANTITILIK